MTLQVILEKTTWLGTKKAVAVACVAALPRLLQAGDTDDGAEGLEVVFVAALGGQDPGHGLVALVVGQFGGGSIAVGQEDQAIVFLVLVVEVDGGLEIGAAATDDTDTVGRLLEQQGFLGSDFAVKLDDLDALDALLEEAVDDSKEFFYILVGNTAADVNGDEQAGTVGILAAHRVPAVAAIGPHARQVTLGAQDAGAELAEDGAEVLLAHQGALDQGSQVAA